MRISENLSFALQRLMKFSEINESDIVRQTAIPQPTINRLLSGKTPDPRISTLEALAQYFNITIDQLIGKTPLFSGENSSNIDTLPNKKVPIMTWDEVSNYSKILKKIQSNTWNNWTISSSTVSEKAFALIIDKDLGSARFTQGTTIIVEPHREAQDRSYVLVCLKSQKNPVLKQLFIDPPKKYLGSILPTKQFIEVDENERILGTIVESKIQF